MAVDLAQYESQRRGIEDQYSAQSNANTFGRYVGQQRFARDQSTRNLAYQRGYSPMAAGLGRRNLAGPNVQSGIFQRAMQNYVGDYTRDSGYAQQDQDFNDQQFVGNQANYEAARQRALADLEQQQQQAIAEAALQIQALKPFFS